ncbi:MAG: hypothetical protein OSJ27_10615, partial [Candidatus Gastranaerophilales bacterium]|nr:hypothetical protein [Candidatus Gastranaerophilales bacterium]
PAKGVARETAARVQISPSAPRARCTKNRTVFSGLSDFFIRRNIQFLFGSASYSQGFHADDGYYKSPYICQSSFLNQENLQIVHSLFPLSLTAKRTTQQLHYRMDCMLLSTIALHRKTVITLDIRVIYTAHLYHYEKTALGVVYAFHKHH